MNYQVAQSKLIYIFGIDDANHQGLLKIGETTITTDRADILPPNSPILDAAAHERIKQYTNTAGISYQLLHTELAVTDDGKAFGDNAVHKVLINSNIKKKTPPNTNAREWFKVKLPVAIQAIAAVKQNRRNLSGMNVDKIIPITLRPEQKDAVNKTVSYFQKKTGGNEFLWYAKMRFGKTICALEVVRQMKFKKTIIITHRPAVNDSWYDAFNQIFQGSDYEYLSKKTGITAEKNFVYFASIQDLRGSQAVNDKSNLNKNSPVFGMQWDLVIIDEAHEGTQTPLGKDVKKALVKKDTKVLELSGTPFNILDNYDNDNVYIWSYIDEQRAKVNWDNEHPGESNPYDELPKMHIYTYNLGDLLGKSFKGDDDIVFSFKEFFKVANGRFVYESDIKRFLDLLVKPDANNYPYSRADFRDMFRHTLWIIPGVKEAKALSKLLKKHFVFRFFEVVNVAGDGDSDDNNADKALKKVQDAIEENDYTITLSCGRLTTGVTVPEWSAVFMLAGGYYTSEMSYLQTIFRVQSPCNSGGVSKRNCYVFDFAPDRALKMVAESVAVSTRAGQTTNNDRQALVEFMNFCPVIAQVGSVMKSLNPAKILGQLKRAHAERAVRNGFDDRSLYNNELLNLSKLDIEKFNHLSGIIGKSDPQCKPKTIVINEQGLKGDTDTGDNQKRQRTEAEKEAARKAAVKRNAISILRGISIRMPLLIYGAEGKFDEDISIEQFVRIVDDASWEEFMPKGVTKKLFEDFIKYYDPEIFIEAGRRIRERAKAADDLTPSERIKEIAELFATFKNPDKETVLTPWNVVKLHVDSAFDEKFFTPDKSILDINAKTGLYPLYVAYKIYRARLGQVDETKIPLAELQRLWDMTVADNVFVICKTPMAKRITQRTLLGFRAGSVNAQNFKDLIPTLKNIPTRFINRITDKNFWSKGVGKMFFDGVVGNPPYQIAGTGDNKTFAAPVYNLFMEAAFKLSDKVSLIHPARCLFNAGATPQDFRNRLLANKHVKVVKYFPDSKRYIDVDGEEKPLFPTSDIKGGVAIIRYDKNQTFEPIGIFIPFDELISINDKVRAHDKPFRSFSEIMYASEIYHFTEKMHKDFPDAASRLSTGHAYDLKTSVFEKLPDIFLNDKPDDGHEYIQILGLIKLQRAYKWIRRDYVNSPPPLTKFKGLVPHSNGSGALGEVVSTPLVGSPLVGCTQTFITVGAFDTRAEAEACIAYIRSKFCRVMLGILKVTQHNPPQTWSMVPMQDFNPATSDIDWSGNVDAQLYAKYGLNDKEIKFIEDNVKAM